MTSLLLALSSCGPKLLPQKTLICLRSTFPNITRSATFWARIHTENTHSVHISFRSLMVKTLSQKGGTPLDSGWPRSPFCWVFSSLLAFGMMLSHGHGWAIGWIRRTILESEETENGSRGRHWEILTAVSRSRNSCLLTTIVQCLLPTPVQYVTISLCKKLTFHLHKKKILSLCLI